MLEAVRIRDDTLRSLYALILSSAGTAAAVDVDMMSAESSRISGVALQTCNRLTSRNVFQYTSMLLMSMSGVYHERLLKLKRVAIIM